MAVWMLAACWPNGTHLPPFATVDQTIAKMWRTVSTSPGCCPGDLELNPRCVRVVRQGQCTVTTGACSFFESINSVRIAMTQGCLHAWHGMLIPSRPLAICELLGAGGLASAGVS